MFQVLHGMNEGSPVDAAVERLVEHKPEELGVAGSERVMVGRPGNEVVGQVTAVSDRGDGTLILIPPEVPRAS